MTGICFCYKSHWRALRLRVGVYRAADEKDDMFLR